MIKSKSEMPRGPIEIDLTGPDGNAYVLMGIAKQLHRQLDLEVSDTAMLAEMMSGDYENLLAVMERYFGDYIVMYR
jgi:hypothetical protein